MLPLNGYGDSGSDRLRHGDVDPRAARERHVLARRREVQVRRDDPAGPDQHPREEVLGAAALVGGDQMPVAVEVVHRLLEPEVAARARVRLVAELHGRALLLGERRRAAVGEQVDEDVLGAQQEGVVSRLDDRLRATLRRLQDDRLHDLGLPGRRKHVFIVAARLRAGIGGKPKCRRRQPADLRLFLHRCHVSSAKTIAVSRMVKPTDSSPAANETTATASITSV